MSLQRKRIRIEADAGKSYTDKLVDVFSGANPEIWRGNDVQIEVGLFLDGTLIEDVSNIDSLTVEVKDASDIDGTALMTKTIAAAAINQTLTSDQWDGNDQANCHALVPFTAAETNISLSDATSKTCWIVVSVITTAGLHITIQAGTLIVYEDGTGAAGEPQNNTDNYFTKGDSDSRFAQRRPDAGSYRIVGGQHIYLYCAGNGLWHPLVVSLVDGVPLLGIGTGEDNPS